jgi:predicted transcriptional regulator
MVIRSYKLVKIPKKELREDAVELRRDKVQELTAKGYPQRQIATMLQISHGTVGNDQMYLRQKAKENVQSYIDEKLPAEYEQCMISINSILIRSWDISDQAEDNREKIQALALAKECYSMKLDLITNCGLIDEGSKFISEQKLKLKPNNNTNTNGYDSEQLRLLNS